MRYGDNRGIGSAHAVEDETQAAVETQLLLLAVELQVDEGQLAPPSTAYQRTTVLRGHLLRVEEPLVQQEHRTVPQLVVSGVSELEIFEISDVNNVLLLDLSVGVFVGADLVLLVDFDHCPLGGAVHAEEVALEAGLQQVVVVLKPLSLDLGQRGEGVVHQEVNLAAEVSHLRVLGNLLDELKDMVGAALQHLPQLVGAEQVIRQQEQSLLFELIAGQ